MSVIMPFCEGLVFIVPQIDSINTFGRSIEIFFDDSRKLVVFLIESHLGHGVKVLTLS